MADLFQLEIIHVSWTLFCVRSHFSIEMEIDAQCLQITKKCLISMFKLNILQIPMSTFSKFNKIEFLLYKIQLFQIFDFLQWDFLSDFQTLCLMGIVYFFSMIIDRKCKCKYYSIS